ncbi:hypothetical protein Tco_0189129 [Tanacetum coccineum]
MAGLQCNKFREENGKIILVILIRAMLLVQGEILQVDRQELLNTSSGKTGECGGSDALSRKERVKPKRVRAMNMIIQSSIKDRILAAQKEAVDEFAVLQKGLD